MNVSLLVVASEVLKGLTIEKNAAWFGSYADSNGFYLKQVQTVRDDPTDILSALSYLSQNSDIVVISGGLGPTEDDLTKSTLAQYFSLELVESKEAKKIAEATYADKGRSWSPSLNNYHIIPKGFTPLANNKGLAPGLSYYCKTEQTLFLATPGVPFEFQAMVHDYLAKLHKKYLKITTQEPNTRLVFRLFGIAEEKLFKKVDSKIWQKLSPFGAVSSLPQLLGVNLIVDLADHQKSGEVKSLVQNSPISKFLWHVGNETLEQLVITTLTAKSQTLGAAESCTGGLLSSMLTDIPGSSKVFMGGVVSYSNELKEDFLQVNKQTMIDHGAVSDPVAIEMAGGILKTLNTDYSITLTGIAGPGGGTAEKPVGTVFIGIGTPKGVTCKKYQFFGDRGILKQRFALAALYELYKKIQGI